MMEKSSLNMRAAAERANFHCKYFYVCGAVSNFALSLGSVCVFMSLAFTQNSKEMIHTVISFMSSSSGDLRSRSEL